MRITGGDGEGSYPIIAAYLGADQYSAKLYSAQAQLASQPRLMRDQVEALVTPPVPHTVLLERYPDVDAAITNISNPSLSQQGFRGSYDAGVLTSLSFVSHILNSSTAAAHVDQTKLDAIRAAADDLKSLIVDDAEMDDTVRRILYEHIAAIVRSLELVKVSGVEIVLQESDRLWGHLRRDPEIISQVATKPDVLSGLRKLGAALSVVAVIFTSAVQIEADIESLLAINAPPSSTHAPASDNASDPT